MDIGIIGTNSGFGRELQEKLSKNHNIYFFDRNHPYYLKAHEESDEKMVAQKAQWLIIAVDPQLVNNIINNSLRLGSVLNGPYIRFNSVLSIIGKQTGQKYTIPEDVLLYPLEISSEKKIRVYPNNDPRIEEINRIIEEDLEFKICQ